MTESNDNQTTETGRRRRGGRIFRIFMKVFFVLALLVAVGLFVLASIGGKSDALHRGVEAYLTEATGYKASVGDFRNMEFFPLLVFEGGDITWEDGKGDVVAALEDARVAMPFVSLIGAGKTLEALEMRGLKVKKEMAGGAALEVPFFGIRARADGSSHIALEGVYGTHNITASVQVKKKDRGDKPARYRVHKNSEFMLRAGALQLDGVMRRRRNMIEAEISRKQGEDAPEKLLSVEAKSGRGIGGVRYRGVIKGDYSTVGFDLKFVKGGLEGTLHGRPFDLADIDNIVAVVDGIDALMPSDEAPDPVDLAGFDLDIEADLETVTGKGRALGHLRFPVTLKAESLTIGPLAGRLSKGAPDGTIKLDAAVDPAVLAVNLHLKKWDYGPVQEAFYGRKNVTGTADVEAELSSEAETWQGLRENMTGHMGLVAGEGHMASAALNIWGAGLVNTLLPKLDPESETVVNCAIADFKVKGGIAEADPLFFDTKRVTVIGTGKINLIEDTIDIKLDPRTKDTALLDVATSVSISGPLAAPSISPASASLGKTIGGIVLGVINPATLLVTMTDFGLTPDHPCHEYIEKADNNSQTENADGTEQTE